MSLCSPFCDKDERWYFPASETKCSVTYLRRNTELEKLTWEEFVKQMQVCGDLGSSFGSVQRLSVPCSEPQINVIVISFSPDSGQGV